jgi:hypothetical protein|tara:strand:+ start:1327 stop:1473 length:147 start_codon:yes stop_codon:yes gene_type:complete
MKSKLKILSAIIFFLWIIGFFFFELGIIVHLALVAATIVLILGVVYEK